MVPYTNKNLLLIKHIKTVMKEFGKMEKDKKI